MRNKHRDIHIRPLPVEPKAISYEPEQQLYIWDSTGKLLRIDQNWVGACLNYNGKSEREQCQYSTARSRKYDEKSIGNPYMKML
jgi:hypothetical protein